MKSRQRPIRTYAIAYELHNEGLTWNEIAEILGFEYGYNLAQAIYKLEKNGFKK